MARQRYLLHVYRHVRMVVVAASLLTQLPRHVRLHLLLEPQPVGVGLLKHDVARRVAGISAPLLHGTVVVVETQRAYLEATVRLSAPHYILLSTAQGAREYDSEADKGEPEYG